MRKCETCDFLGSTESVQAVDPPLWICRRNAPTVCKVITHEQGTTILSGWPYIKIDDWCGEYRIRIRERGA